METSGKSFLETIDDHKFKRSTNAGDLPAVKAPNGKYYCKFCGKMVSVNFSRKYYCSNVCLEEMHIRAGFFRYKVLRRDKRTCQICFQRGDEVDHIVPVSEGGGSCGLDNLRTLCRKCHQDQTNKLMNRLREKKKRKKLVFRRKKSEVQSQSKHKSGSRSRSELSERSKGKSDERKSD